ncbi:uncharacterized protein PB18E9.04c-like isoform X1 [Pseudomyrmex gracilis]|uniref:uncharacterized protein PB18E9.04c-like isoform X1 n=1 Tax=Pseudomyrmex gracilis TaxID=219809 RepID=UPI000995BF45|nr:uncharacterized protein PB18E9.04c-like isoform X1 [Pseudomyrmex gracilis]
MDVRRTFPFLLLMICAAFAIRNHHGDLNGIRRIRKVSLSEYLVPPPPPRFYPGRSPRTASSTEKPGYLSQFWDMINPFNYGTTLPSLPPPPPSTPYETIYTSSPQFNQPRPPPPADYDKPPLPPSSFNNNPGYSTPVKTSCNSCNKVPWTPLQTNDVTHSGDALHAPPTPQVLPINGDYPPPINGNYLPPSNPEIPYDAHHAASQNVRAPDYSVVPLSTDGQDLGSLPDPRLYPELVPPVNKAQNFHISYQDTDPSLGKYLIYLNSPTSPGLTSPAVINQELGYNNPDASNEQFSVQNYDTHSDLSSSGTHVTHANPVPNNQKFENIESHSSLPDSSYQQASLDNPNILQPSGISNNGRPYDVTGFFNNSSQIDQNPPSSYGISDPDQVQNNSENQYHDLSPSGNVAKDTYVSPSIPVKSTKTEDSIHFEESPLLDFTHKGESRTKSSSISPTSNAIAESAETVESTLAPGEEVFGTRQRAVYSQTTDSLSLQPKVNTTNNLNRSVYNSKVMRLSNISYVPSSAETTVSQNSSISTTTTTTTTTTTPPPQSILSRLFSWPLPWPFSSDVESTSDSKKDASNQRANLNSEATNKTSVNHQGVKKQVQLIIPYTQQHTPLPFSTQKVPWVKFNHKIYVAKESAKAIKVTSLPDSTNAITRPTTSVTLEDHTRKPAGTVANNSIDVHKLQRNIDNWIIQEYSKRITESTTSPLASLNLFPSKKIPREYLTTTESLDSIADKTDDKTNVKTFTLGGFTFNDVDYKASTSNRVEQKSQVQEEQKNSTDDASVPSPNNDDAWRGFSLDISNVNKEPVYVVTSQSIVTTHKADPVEQRKETAIKERNPEESRQETNAEKNTTNTFEKAYQVLPQAVNNLAVASTGPESVPLWGIMEHEEFSTPDDKEHDETDEADETSENPVLYFGHSKVSRARR